MESKERQDFFNSWINGLPAGRLRQFQSTKYSLLIDPRRADSPDLCWDVHLTLAPKGIPASLLAGTEVIIAVEGKEPVDQLLNQRGQTTFSRIADLPYSVFIGSRVSQS